MSFISVVPYYLMMCYIESGVTNRAKSVDLYQTHKQGRPYSPMLLNRLNYPSTGLGPSCQHIPKRICLLFYPEIKEHSAMGYQNLFSLQLCRPGLDKGSVIAEVKPQRVWLKFNLSGMILGD